MSVTFAIEGVPSLITSHTAAPTCKEADGTLCDLMEDCWDFLDGPGINLSNANAAAVLVAMGLDSEDLWGSMSVADFLGHVLVGQGTADDSAIPTVTDKLPGQATFIDCGRREGYMSDVMGRLADLCAQADSMGADTIQWG